MVYLLNWNLSRFMLQYGCGYLNYESSPTGEWFSTTDCVTIRKGFICQIYKGKLNVN